MRELFNQTNLQMRGRPTASHAPLFDVSSQFLIGVNKGFDQTRLSSAVAENNARTNLDAVFISV